MKAIRLISCAILLTAACATQRVTRTSATSTQGGDLSGYWNDIDANVVAEEMIKDCTSSGLTTHFAKDSGALPVVKLMGVLKRTDDRNVNSDYFAKRLERELLRSG